MDTLNFVSYKMYTMFPYRIGTPDPVMGFVVNLATAFPSPGAQTLFCRVEKNIQSIFSVTDCCLLGRPISM